MPPALRTCTLSCLFNPPPNLLITPRALFRSDARYSILSLPAFHLIVLDGALNGGPVSRVSPKRLLCKPAWKAQLYTCVSCFRGIRESVAEKNVKRLHFVKL